MIAIAVFWKAHGGDRGALCTVGRRRPRAWRASDRSTKGMNAASSVSCALRYTMTILYSLSATHLKYKRQRPQDHSSHRISSLPWLARHEATRTAHPQNPDAGRKGKAPSANDVVTCRCWQPELADSDMPTIFWTVSVRYYKSYRGYDVF